MGNKNNEELLICHINRIISTLNNTGNVSNDHLMLLGYLVYLIRIGGDIYKKVC